MSGKKRFHRKNGICSSAAVLKRLLPGVLILVLLAAGFSGLTYRASAAQGQEAAASSEESGQTVRLSGEEKEKHVLVLFSYTTSWQGERDVLKGMTSCFTPSIRLDLVFMGVSIFMGDIYSGSQTKVWILYSSDFVRRSVHWANRSYSGS